MAFKDKKTINDEEISSISVNGDEMTIKIGDTEQTLDEMLMHTAETGDTSMLEKLASTMLEGLVNPETAKKVTNKTKKKRVNLESPFDDLPIDIIEIAKKYRGQEFIECIERPLNDANTVKKLNLKVQVTALINKMLRGL